MPNRTTNRWTILLLVFLIAITVLRLTWMNFITSIDYPHNPSAVIGIRVKNIEGYFEVSVRDNGKGMTEEERKQIFIHTEQTTNEKRTGVGLRNIDRRLKQLTIKD